MSSSQSDTRTKILQATVALLENGPAAGVRMADIAKRTGISRQALYLHFPNRADLLIATTRHLDEVHEVAARLTESRSAASGTARLAAFIEAWGGYIPSIYGIAKALMAMQDSDAAARAAWQDRMQAVREGCAAAIDALAADGVLTPELSREQATDWLWTLLSVRNWEALRHDCGWPQDRYLAQMQRSARQTLLAQPAFEAG